MTLSQSINYDFSPVNNVILDTSELDNGTGNNDNNAMIKNNGNTIITVIKSTNIQKDINQYTEHVEKQT